LTKVQAASGATRARHRFERRVEGGRRVPPLPRETRLKVIAGTVQATPPNAPHWNRSAMAEAVGISPSSVGR